MTVALVALGSNLEPRRRHLLGAVAELALLPRTRVLATSTLHETQPIGCPDGSPSFLNGACLLETELSPHALLAGLRAIEVAHGRSHSEPRNAPRTLDLDLVLHGATVLGDLELTLPHPRAHERLFVLEPAAEIAPELRLPGQGRSLAQLRDAARDEARDAASGAGRDDPGGRRVRVLSERAAVVAACRRASAAGSLALVPTMGALHEGHLTLVRRARSENACVAVSIFVNPLQFDDPADLARYPRQEQQDAALLERAGADLVLVLQADELYPPGFATRVSLDERLSAVFEGAARPGHFTGVATVVTKLLNLAGPARAYFGRKDFQQCAVVRRLVADLELPVEVVVCETVRDADGLALSSRNALLAPDERRRGLGLVAALAAAERAFESGERDARALLATAREALLPVLGGPPDYLALVDAELSPRDTARAGDALLVAARVGRVRLIDNHLLGARIAPFSG